MFLSERLNHFMNQSFGLGQKAFFEILSKFLNLFPPFCGKTECLCFGAHTFPTIWINRRLLKSDDWNAGI